MGQKVLSKYLAKAFETVRSIKLELELRLPPIQNTTDFSKLNSPLSPKIITKELKD